MTIKISMITSTPTLIYRQWQRSSFWGAKVARFPHAIIVWRRLMQRQAIPWPVYSPPKPVVPICSNFSNNYIWSVTWPALRTAAIALRNDQIGAASGWLWLLMRWLLLCWFHGISIFCRCFIFHCVGGWIIIGGARWYWSCYCRSRHLNWGHHGDDHTTQQGKGELLQQIHWPICCRIVGPGSNIGQIFVFAIVNYSASIGEITLKSNGRGSNCALAVVVSLDPATTMDDGCLDCNNRVLGCDCFVSGTYFLFEFGLGNIWVLHPVHHTRCVLAIHIQRTVPSCVDLGYAVAVCKSKPLANLSVLSHGEMAMPHVGVLSAVSWQRVIKPFAWPRLRQMYTPCILPTDVCWASHLMGIRARWMHCDDRISSRPSNF